MERNKILMLCVGCMCKELVVILIVRYSIVSS